MLVGGIGSGKTTELLLAQAELGTHDQILPLYVDISAETNLTTVNPGALLCSLGMHLLTKTESKVHSSKELAEVGAALKASAFGGEQRAPFSAPEFPLKWYLEDKLPSKAPGRGRPPFPAIERDVKELTTLISRLLTFGETQRRDVVAIFDGLDRLMKWEDFWSVAEQDLRALKPLEISVLVAGPLSIMYSQGRQVKDYFDEVHYLPPAIADPKKSPFLFEILRLRGAEELMRPEQMQLLCLASGGVLRDLISLARSAGENAYIDDADQIDGFHVARSIEQLGNSYLLGLGTRQKAILQKLQESGSFAPSDSDSMELLVSRRVLEQSESRYEVHPALASVLPASPGKPE